MKQASRIRFALLSAVVVVAMVAMPAMAVAAEATVNLGTTAGFAVLAGTTITNTGTTTITGDVGLHPGPSVTDNGVLTVSGEQYIADAVANQAKIDLVTAYNDAAGRSVSNTLGVELGGLTLGPGVYSSGDVLELTGTLTLDAHGDPDAVFIFKSTSTLVTAAQSRIELANGARFCRVFWVVPSSATLGTDSVFVGHILALTDITVQTGATVEGQLLARNGQVTLDSNVIVNEICAAARVINLTKTASPTTLPAGGGPVTYTYTVTNPGTVELSSVAVTDDKISTVTYVSGDINKDQILQPDETWVYTSKARLAKTTTNIGTVVGTGAGVVVTDSATATVTVAAGRLLPNTATPWYGVLLAGIVLIVLGAVGRIASKVHV